MVKKISLEHAIRNVVRESIGGPNTDKFKGTPKPFLQPAPHIEPKVGDSHPDGASAAAKRGNAKIRTSETMKEEEQLDELNSSASAYSGGGKAPPRSSLPKKIGGKVVGGFGIPAALGAGIEGAASYAKGDSPSQVVGSTLAGGAKAAAQSGIWWPVSSALNLGQGIARTIVPPSEEEKKTSKAAQIHSKISNVVPGVTYDPGEKENVPDSTPVSKKVEQDFAEPAKREAEYGKTHPWSRIPMAAASGALGGINAIFNAADRGLDQFGKTGIRSMDDLNKIGRQAAFGASEGWKTGANLPYDIYDSSKPQKSEPTQQKKIQDRVPGSESPSKPPSIPGVSDAVASEPPKKKKQDRVPTSESVQNSIIKQVIKEKVSEQKIIHSINEYVLPKSPKVKPKVLAPEKPPVELPKPKTEPIRPKAPEEAPKKTDLEPQKAPVEVPQKKDLETVPDKVPSETPKKTPSEAPTGTPKTDLERPNKPAPKEIPKDKTVEKPAEPSKPKPETKTKTAEPTKQRMPWSIPSVHPSILSGLQGYVPVKTYMHYANDRATFGESKDADTERRSIENVARPGSKNKLTKQAEIKAKIIDENEKRVGAIKKVIDDKKSTVIIKPKLKNPETDQNQL